MRFPRMPERRTVAAVGGGALVVAVLAYATQCSAATTGPTLTVDATSDVHVIPDAIYGINFASQSTRNDLQLPVNRWGGNGTSLYDYRNDAFNNGNDWYFENQVGSDSDHQVSPWVEANRATSTNSLVTLPMVGWVADGSKPTNCGYSKAKYGAQQQYDTWRPDCGNGVRLDGARIVSNNPTDFAVQVDPATQATGMVHSLVSKFGAASNGGVGYYELDNEPGLWNDTHRAAHPSPLSRDELFTKSLATAAAVKAADSGAAVVGPSDWGYCGWLYAPADGDPTDGCDPPTSGSTEELTGAYVRAFKSYADTHGGKRLLDYLDQHYYPQSNGVALTTSPGSTDTQALRLRSTRSLWDPTYKDESWIGNTQDVNAPPLQFIRKLRGWASIYPGTKTAISEYNWGGTNSINGALAQADVLGIFGRERLDLATYWNYDNAIDGTSVEAAFRMYRNYDGHESHFGENGVSASSTDQDRLSVYAAKGQRSLTIIVINKTNDDLSSSLNLSGYAHRSPAQTYTLGPANPVTITTGSTGTGRARFDYPYPAQSVTLFRISQLRFSEAEVQPLPARPASAPTDSVDGPTAMRDDGSDEDDSDVIVGSAGPPARGDPAARPDSGNVTQAQPVAINRPMNTSARPGLPAGLLGLAVIGVLGAGSLALIRRRRGAHHED
ncbi:MAG: glycoside hydrolase family 44 protein [Aeromicrobium sp.]